MVSSSNSPVAHGNRLLSCLSDDAYASLAPMPQTVDLGVQQMLHERVPAACSATRTAL